MKRLARIAAAVALAGSLLGAGTALADGRGPRRDWTPPAREQRGDDRPRRWDDGPPRAYKHPGQHVRPPPPGYGVRRGGRLPPEYRGAVVPDYRRRHLRPPPPGFNWVRMGDRYMLVSRDTGQIFDVIRD